MTVAEIAKRIKREPAEIVKKLFMMGVMATTYDPPKSTKTAYIGGLLNF